MPSPHNYSHLNAFERILALQQGGIKPKRLPLYNAARICRQAAEQRDCPRLELAPHNYKQEKEEEGRKDEEVEVFEFCLRLLVRIPNFSKCFRSAQALRREEQINKVGTVFPPMPLR